MSTADLRAEMQLAMTDDAAVFRDGKSLASGVERWKAVIADALLAERMRTQAVWGRIS